MLRQGSGGIAADAAKGLAQRLHPEQKLYMCLSCCTYFETVMRAKK
jgi:hypothetical protein